MLELRYLLLQIRDAEDPIGPQEVGCFAKALGCKKENIRTLDLLSERLTTAKLDAVDAVLIGGSGNYSAAGESQWLENVLADLRQLCDSRKPTFASCWGFQAIARALGGRCIHDPDHSELGTLELSLTVAGRADPLFCELGEEFFGLAGHEDRVTELPPDAILLASSELVPQQAFKLADAPIYCTQFHPELELATYLERVAAYPRYVEKIAGSTFAVFAKHCHDTPESRELLKRFAQLVEESQQAPG